MYLYLPSLAVGNYKSKREREGNKLKIYLISCTYIFLAVATIQLMFSLYLILNWVQQTLYLVLTILRVDVCVCVRDRITSFSWMIIAFRFRLRGRGGSWFQPKKGMSYACCIIYSALLHTYQRALSWSRPSRHLRVFSNSKSLSPSFDFSSTMQE